MSMTGTVEFPAERWDDDRKEEELTLFAISEDTAVSFRKHVEDLAQVLTQMAQLMTSMQHRLDQLEEKERLITLSHEEVKGVQALIRLRTAEYCEQYGITAPGCLRSVSAGIKKAILARYGVKDLHDVPAIARQAVEAQISRWSDVRLMMKCRERLRDGGA